MTMPIAKCSFVLDKELFFKGSSCVDAELTGKTLKRTVIVLVLLWLGISAYTLLTGGGMVYAISELVVVLAFVLLITVWLPYKRKTKAWHAMEASGKTNIRRVICFYDDRLEIEIAGEITVIDYSDISKTIYSRDLLVLITHGRKGIIIEKNSFNTGSCNELPAIIKQHGGLQA